MTVKKPAPSVTSDDYPREGDQRYDLYVFAAGGPERVVSGSDDAGQALWAKFRAYDSPEAASRAAKRLRNRFPGAHMVVCPWTWRGWWSGAVADHFALYWCPRCGERLDWADDSWICGGPRGCGDEWHDEDIRPGVDT